jgi:hypothetical protein
MIKNKENINNVLNELKEFSYDKDGILVDVALYDNLNVNIRYYEDNCIKIDYCDYDNAISTLYKDRKYINKVLFQ